MLIAHIIKVLAAGRALQAIGGYAVMALARAAIRDVHDRAGSASMIGYVTSAMVIAHMLASPVGGWLFEHHGLFAVLTIPLVAGIAAFSLCPVGLHKTLVTRGTMPVHIGGITLANFRVLSNANYRACALSAAFSATAY
jgi:DHA1 family bicyclomycin/chloramphenicol resistance-like MFS transporter